MIEGVYGSATAQLIYAVFTTPPNSISGSAVCAFALQDITDTFEGNFKEQAQLNSNWLPVQSAKVIAEIAFRHVCPGTPVTSNNLIFISFISN
jgi:hypothetical protein